MGIRKGGKAPRRRKNGKFKGLADFKAAGWSIKRDKKASRRRNAWVAKKKGVTICASCTRSLINRMTAKEPF